jgi:hypothetical protein
LVKWDCGNIVILVGNVMLGNLHSGIRIMFVGYVVSELTLIRIVCGGVIS